jgi:hypothetical protein
MPFDARLDDEYDIRDINYKINCLIKWFFPIISSFPLILLPSLILGPSGTELYLDCAVVFLFLLFVIAREDF